MIGRGRLRHEEVGLGVWAYILGFRGLFLSIPVNDTGIVRNIIRPIVMMISNYIWSVRKPLNYLC